jgi:hypothetical protein
MEAPGAFTIESSRQEVEIKRKIRLKHAKTCHVYEFQIALSDAGWVVEVTSPNSQSQTDPIEYQAAARRAAREFIKSYSIEKMPHEISGEPARQRFLFEG